MELGAILWFLDLHNIWKYKHIIRKVISVGEKMYTKSEEIYKRNICGSETLTGGDKGCG